MPEYNFNFDWNRISTLGKVKVLVEQVVGAPSQEAINTAVAEYIEAHPGSLSPLSSAVKAALLQIAEKVAYIDENGQDYYNALDAALNAVAVLQITAVYTQTGTVYDTDSLDSLKDDLVVTAYYDDGTTADVTSASVLSGTLEEGTSTITVTYGGKSDTFNVTVTAFEYVWANGCTTDTSSGFRLQDNNVQYRDRTVIGGNVGEHIIPTMNGNYTGSLYPIYIKDGITSVTVSSPANFDVTVLKYNESATTASKWQKVYASGQTASGGTINLTAYSGSIYYVAILIYVRNSSVANTTITFA